MINIIWDSINGFVNYSSLQPTLVAIKIQVARMTCPSWIPVVTKTSGGVKKLRTHR